MFREEATQLDSFLKPMLSIDPALRCTAEEALRHDWLAGADTNVPIPLDTPTPSESETGSEDRNEETSIDATIEPNKPKISESPP